MAEVAMTLGMPVARSVLRFAVKEARLLYDLNI